MQLVPLYEDDGGWIDHKAKLVDWDSWAEAGGTQSPYAIKGYRPASEKTQ